MSDFHFRVNLRTRRFELTDEPVAARLWHGLRKAFPLALAAILMPDHFHLILRCIDWRAARRRLAHVAAGAVWGLGRGTWWPIEPPREISNFKHLRRQVRYVHLNPNRDHLVDDPARWLWSTHRDALGAVVQPWVSPTRLAAELRWVCPAFGDEFHHFVSADFTVDVGGTAPPRPFVDRGGVVPDLDDVIAAVAVARRTSVDTVLATPASRRLALGLAREVGWNETPLLREVFGVSRRTVARSGLRRDDPRLAPLLLILGDERLLHPAPAPVCGLDSRLVRIAHQSPTLSPTTKSDFLASSAPFSGTRASEFMDLAHIEPRI